MYMTIRQYQADQQSIHEILRQDRLSFAPTIAKAHGFREYTCVDSGHGSITSISVFDDRAAAERFDVVVHDWVKSHMGAMLPSQPYVISGVIEHHTAGASMLGRVANHATGSVAETVSPA
jgi:hypothetical protein